jgi:hypothetical protein
MLKARAIDLSTLARACLQNSSVTTMTTLDLDRTFFDSNDTGILGAAFDKAWAFVESDPSLEVLEVSKRQSELARCLMALEKLGETNPTSLANAAIAMLRARHQRKRTSRTPRVK